MYEDRSGTPAMMASISFERWRMEVRGEMFEEQWFDVYWARLGGFVITCGMIGVAGEGC